MAPLDTRSNRSRIVAGRFPPPGTDPYADAIRKHRGAQGLSPLDANLLHVPAIAGGYSVMLRAIKTGGKLPGDVREAMILRVAAINHAAFEWTQHESVAREEGLSTAHLFAIRSTGAPLQAGSGVLNELQTAAIKFTDHSTLNTRIPMPIVQEFKKQLKAWVVTANPSMPPHELDAKTDDLYVEAVMVVASYNMVSRFLVGTDVAGLSDAEVPWPKGSYSAVPADAYSRQMQALAPAQPMWPSQIATSNADSSTLLPLPKDSGTSFGGLKAAPQAAAVTSNPYSGGHGPAYYPAPPAAYGQYRPPAPTFPARPMPDPAQLPCPPSDPYVPPVRAGWGATYPVAPYPRAS